MSHTTDSSMSGTRRARALRGVLAASALACAQLSPATLVPAFAVERGGTVVQAEWIAVPSLDPHLSSAVTSVVWSNMFDSLFSYTPPQGPGDTYEIGPALATSYELVEGTLVELTLRDDAVFHDGTALDAEAVKWNLERARDHEMSTRKLSVENISEITVVDDHTLRIRLASPQPLFDVLLSPANPANVYMVSPQAVEQMGEEEFARQPVGSGPFRVVDYRPDDRIVLERFDDHWEVGEDGEPLPYADALTIRFVPDQSVAALELRAGSIHVAEPLQQDIAALAADPDIATHEVPLTDRALPSFYITSKPELGSPFAGDVRLRQAVQHAVNREAMAAVMGFGNATAHYYWGWYPGVPGYDESLPRYEYDPEKARELLAEAGFGDGISLDVKVINRPRDVQPLEIMQGMLSEVGIDLNIVLLDRTPWIDSGRSGNFEALSHANTANIDPLLRQQTRTGSSSNWAGYSNPDVDALWEKVSNVADVAERAEIYRQMQRIMHEDAYFFIGYRIPTIMAHSAKLHGIGKTGGYGMRYAWIEQ
ncbi:MULTISPECIES: ABC transporter substrate-binding protein [unclassified Roseitalea]|uniref:ABC transporter substrate-binding protein n=1 Tax=unclassified Roseitalea TaxID=2639107 RepID=UPI00273EEA89|nr:MULTISPECIES: ABC transporter substrate-binding protein [unclassified Roseitalea]